MNLLRILERFPDQEACLDHLEEIRFGISGPFCPLCGSIYVAKKSDRGRLGRWNCYGCRSSFNVLSGTLFQKTRIPLQKWFLTVCLVLNARKGISTYQLARDLDMCQSTVWTMMKRIRLEMANWQDHIILKGIVEADETYLGPEAAEGSRRGWGTTKAAILGAVQRQGPVTARVLENVTSEEIRDFAEDTIFEGSTLNTDGLKAYRNLSDIVTHRVITRTKGRFRGSTHTNTIEGFWSIIKRSWYGIHQHFRKRNMPLYLAEFCYRYSTRRDPDDFEAFIEICISEPPRELR